MVCFLNQECTPFIEGGGREGSKPPAEKDEGVGGEADRGRGPSRAQRATREQRPVVSKEVGRRNEQASTDQRGGKTVKNEGQGPGEGNDDAVLLDDGGTEFRIEFTREAKEAAEGGRYLWIPVEDLFTTPCPEGLSMGTSIMELPAVKKRPRTALTAEWIRRAADDLYAHGWVSSMIGAAHTIMAPTREGGTRGREELGVSPAASQEDRMRTDLPTYLRRALATPRWMPALAEPYEQFWSFKTPNGNEDMDIRLSLIHI